MLELPDLVDDREVGTLLYQLVGHELGAKWLVRFSFREEPVEEANDHVEVRQDEHPHGADQLEEDVHVGRSGIPAPGR